MNGNLTGDGTNTRPGYVQVLESSPEAKISGGWLDVPREAGLGVRLAADRVQQFLFATCRG